MSSAAACPKEGPQPPPPPSRKGLSWSLALALALLAAWLNLGLAQQLDTLKVFRDANVLFDCDPMVQLESFSEGTNTYGRNLSHPNLGNLIHPPVRAVAALRRQFGEPRGTPERTRRDTALFVSPVASGLKALVLFFVFRGLGLSLLSSTLMVLLVLSSFSQLIFGSVPEHWSLGGLVTSLAFLLGLDQRRRAGSVRWWAWVATGTAAMGFTTTNVLLVALLFWIARSSLGVAKATGQALFLVLACSLLTLLLSLGGRWAFNVEEHQNADQLQNWTERHMETEPLEKVLHFPAALADSISPADPRLVENRIGKQRRLMRDYQFSLETPPRRSPTRPLGALVLALAVLGGMTLWRSSPVNKSLCTGAVLVLLYNFAFHAIWGQEYFLYSQHWHAALIILISGVLLVTGRHALPARILFALFLGWVMINNEARIEYMMDILTRFRP